jgi:hypothetical protein
VQCPTHERTGFPDWGKWALQKTNPVHPSFPLRLGGERRGKQRRSARKERSPIHHSIT